MRVTDLDKFSLEEIWRPYQNMAGLGDKPISTPPMDLRKTAVALKSDTTGWADRVLNRIHRIGVFFPSYIRHPLVSVVKAYHPSEANQ